MSNPFTAGQRVRITLAERNTVLPFDLVVGTEATVAEVVNDTLVRLEQDLRGGRGFLKAGHPINIAWLEAVPATAERPQIDFSIDRYATVRGYAADLSSKVNKAESNNLLYAVKTGQSVDAYALAAALPDILSGCATRKGNSNARREDTRKARALGHVVHAVLANHAAGLPVYAEGDRSRVVEQAKVALREAEVEMNHQREVNQNLSRDLTTERGKVAGLRNRIAEEAEGARQARVSKQEANRERDAAEAKVEGLLADIQRLNNLYAAAERSRENAVERAVDWEQRAVAAADHNDEDSDLLTYALGLLDDTQRARFQGFKDAVRR